MARVDPKALASTRGIRMDSGANDTWVVFDSDKAEPEVDWPGELLGQFKYRHEAEEFWRGEIIRAYLSALPASPTPAVGDGAVSGLVERLRDDTDGLTAGTQEWLAANWALRNEAASALVSRDAARREWEACEIRLGDEIDANKSAWAKHGGTEIALGQAKARADALQARVDELTRAPTYGEVRGVAIEITQHRGERPFDVSFGGGEKWEEYLPLATAAIHEFRRARSLLLSSVPADD